MSKRKELEMYEEILMAEIEAQEAVRETIAEIIAAAVVEAEY